MNPLMAIGIILLAWGTAVLLSRKAVPKTGGSGRVVSPETEQTARQMWERFRADPRFSDLPPWAALSIRHRNAMIAAAGAIGVTPAEEIERRVLAVAENVRGR